MSRSLYVLILLLIGVGFWNVKPIGGFLSQDVCLLLFIIWFFYGYNSYRPKNYRLLCNVGYNKPIILIAVAVFVSFIPAYWFYGQPFLQSIVVNRQLISYLGLPLLLIVRPSFDELKKSLYCFAFLFTLVTMADSILGIDIVDRAMQSYNYDSQRDYIADGEFVHILRGFQFIPLAFIFSLDDLRTSVRMKELLLSTFLLSIIYIVQNRSTLFPCALLYVFTIIHAKGGKFGVLMKTGILVFIVIMITYTAVQWKSLFIETQTQILDEDSNRTKAYIFFLTAYSPHWICNIIGNGLISIHSSTIMQSLMAMGIYNSDVGLVGFWNHYGLLPVVVILSLVIKAFNRNMSYVVKCNAFLLLVCSFTIGYFVNIQYILWLCLFIYMYSYNDLINRFNRYSD